MAIGKYASANGGLYPPRISTLAENGLLSIPDRSPQGGGPWVYGGLGQRFPAGAHVVILHDNNTSDGKRTCLFGDGHVQTINMADWRNVFHESNLSKRTGQ